MTILNGTIARRPAICAISVSFEMARRAFADVFAVARADRRQDYGENRYPITGMVEGRLLFVAYTFRENRIRIISARHAQPY